ncbi:MAG: hypothetical protein HOP30_11135 [Cyclobacteriaceae bacterium]|nr:hypothetical protein [Cyclobacteriaceae bacterium]
MSHPIIDRNLKFIQDHLETHTIFWIGNQIGVNKATMHRYAKLNGWKGKDMKQALSIEWSELMITTLKAKFPNTFNAELAKEVGVSPRTLIRKARQLGLEKEPGFLDKNRETITEMAKEKRPPNGQETIDRITELGIPFRFKKGNVPPSIRKYAPEVIEAIRTLSELKRKIKTYEKQD